jgi:hypothetical protein
VSLTRGRRFIFLSLSDGSDFCSRARKGQLVTVWHAYRCQWPKLDGAAGSYVGAVRFRYGGYWDEVQQERRTPHNYARTRGHCTLMRVSRNNAERVG